MSIFSIGRLRHGKYDINKTSSVSQIKMNNFQGQEMDGPVVGWLDSGKFGLIA